LSWYTGLWSNRTQTAHSYPHVIKRNKLQSSRLTSKRYRNPVIFARELHDEMVRHGLSRKQLAERHGVSSDRMTQWLCLLKLPEEKLREIEAMEDYWERQVVKERELRRLRRTPYSLSST